MKLLSAILCAVLLVARAQVNPAQRTSAGTQEFSGTKTGGGGSFTSSHSGRNGNNFNGQANSDKTVTGSQGGLKAGVVSEDDLYGESSRGGKATIMGGNDPGTYTGALGSSNVNIDMSKAQEGQSGPLQPVAKTSDGTGVNTELKGDSGKRNLHATNINNPSQKWNIEMTNDKDIQVFKEGSKVADVNNVQSKDDVKVKYNNRDLGKASTHEKQGTDPASRQRTTYDVNKWETGNKRTDGEATLNRKGTYVESAYGHNAIFNKRQFEGSSDLNTNTKEITMKADVSGFGAPVKAKYMEAKDNDCAISNYEDRRAPGEKNTPFKYNEETEIYWDEITVEGKTDRSGNKISAGWPQCMDVNIPLKLPKGIKLEQTAIGISIYFPKCPQLVCAGRTCGLEATAYGGFLKESCFVDNICDPKPVRGSSAKHDWIGVPMRNGEAKILDGSTLQDMCNKGYNGDKLVVKTRICQNEPDLSKGQAPCPIFNSKPDAAAKIYQVIAVATIYEQKACPNPFACTLRKTLPCNIDNFYMHGCRYMGTGYKLLAFNLDSDSKTLRGVEKKSEGAQTSSNRGGFFGSLWRPQG